MYQAVMLHQLLRSRLWIMLVSFKVFLMIILMYILCLGFIVMETATYIEYDNWTILLFTTVLLFIMILIGLGTIVESNTRIQFLAGKK
ncbi:DUF443 family protein [Oceanobacillus jeddahense]|uniref:DUF443 family protein n=1 Tax=Oceanobacillus jeddahense TaxID=1462527 RepID=UPI0009457327